jgi:hypothetical protein
MSIRHELFVDMDDRYADSPADAFDYTYHQAAEQYQLDLSFDFTSRDSYSYYLDQLLNQRLQAGLPPSQKAVAQWLLNRFELNEPETKIIDSYNIELLTTYVDYLLNKCGRKEIWISSCIITDHSDVLGDHKEKAKLFRNICSLADLEKRLHEIRMHVVTHPEILFKVFPQDNKKLSIGRLLLGPDGLSAAVRLNSHTPRGEDVDKDTDLRVFIRPGIKPTIFASEGGERLLDLFSGQAAYLEKLDQAIRLLHSNSPSLVYNPEFMLNTGTNQIQFFTDLIWGNLHAPNKGKSSSFIPSIQKMLSNLDGAPILSMSDRSIDPQQIHENTHAILVEAMNGHPMLTEIKLLIETLTRQGIPLPYAIYRLSALAASEVTPLKNVPLAKKTTEGTSGMRLNHIMLSEKPTSKDMAQTTNRFPFDWLTTNFPSYHR